MVRFIILGLPRSGTTLLADLLHSHPRISCAGERFNPHAIFGFPGQRNGSFETIVARDRDPVSAARAYFAVHNEGDRASGFKVMIGHHPELLTLVESDPEIRIIHIWRENRLAQAESLVKAIETKIWAERGLRHSTSGKGFWSRLVRRLTRARRQPQTPPPQKLEGPLRAARIAREAETQDMLVRRWLHRLPNQCLDVEYTDLLAPDFTSTICEFLSVEASCTLHTRMQKQGNNRIIDRFPDPQPMADYFSATGRSHWLENEVPEDRLGST